MSTNLNSNIGYEPVIADDSDYQLQNSGYDIALTRTPHSQQLSDDPSINNLDIHKIGGLQVVSSRSTSSQVGTDEQNEKHKHHNPITSAYKRVKNMKQLSIFVFISRLLPAVAIFGGAIYLLVLMATPSVWSTDENVTEAEQLSRASDRGVFVSIVIAGLLMIIGAFMFHIKVRESLVVTNYGFILGPVIGFMLDQGIGTEEGWQSFGTSAGFDYTFSSLISGSFMRYIITIFLDLFISNPLQDVMKTQIAKIGVIDALKETDGKNKWLVKYDAFVAMNYPAILQSIVAFVTFNAYTNQTRFAWAYPGTLVRELRIPPGTIMLSTAIASILYLTFYTIMDYISERQYFDVNTKLGYVLAILGLLYGLNGTDSIEAPVVGEEDNVITAPLGDWKPALGILMFAGFVLYGLAYPLWTRIGCCGKCRPTDLGIEEKEDHIATNSIDKTNTIMMQETDIILEKLREQIMNEVRAEMAEGKED